MAKMTLDQFVTQLRAALGADLRTVAVYGSAAVGEQHTGKSDTNVLVVVDSLSAERLAAASATVGAWTEGNTAPLMLTSDEWRGSADIFAMEFADILERHRIVHGAFPSEVRVNPLHLRHELEREAMIAVLQLRRAALHLHLNLALKTLRAFIQRLDCVVAATGRAQGGQRHDEPTTSHFTCSFPSDGMNELH